MRGPGTWLNPSNVVRPVPIARRPQLVVYDHLDDAAQQDQPEQPVAAFGPQDGGQYQLPRAHHGGRKDETGPDPLVNGKEGPGRGFNGFRAEPVRVSVRHNAGHPTRRRSGLQYGGSPVRDHRSVLTIGLS